ncbi:MAG: HEPN domain-containing protein [Deltaproteobacteria bacterium]|nr:HEPN domain-containing protein [Deltaproteobacteria bacterium]
MQPGTDTLLGKARRALAAADAALEGGAPDAAAGRAFYAILYAAKARLNERGLRLRTHARIATAYASLPALHDAPAEALAGALALRAMLAAEPDAFDYADAARLVAQARAFVAAVAG